MFTSNLADRIESGTWIESIYLGMALRVFQSPTAAENEIVEGRSLQWVVSFALFVVMLVAFVGQAGYALALNASMHGQSLPDNAFNLPAGAMSAKAPLQPTPRPIAVTDAAMDP